MTRGIGIAVMVAVIAVGTVGVSPAHASSSWSSFCDQAARIKSAADNGQATLTSATRDYARLRRLAPNARVAAHLRDFGVIAISPIRPANSVSKRQASAYAALDAALMKHCALTAVDVFKVSIQP
jgi:hypothetical protein